MRHESESEEFVRAGEGWRAEGNSASAHASGTASGLGVRNGSDPDMIGALQCDTLDNERKSGEGYSTRCNYCKERNYSADLKQSRGYRTSFSAETPESKSG